jgi:hypothetical protein
MLQDRIPMSQGAWTLTGKVAVIVTEWSDFEVILRSRHAYCKVLDH